MDNLSNLTNVRDMIMKKMICMALALVMKIYEQYGTMDTREVRRLRG